MICPNSVRIFIYPEVPDYVEENVYLLYPGKEAKTLAEAFPECSADVENDVQKPRKELPKRVVFIDSTWHQAKRIYLDPRIAKLPQLLIEGRETVFWRNQKGKSKYHLATIEVRN